jgi:ribosome-binding factor A
MKHQRESAAGAHRHQRVEAAILDELRSVLRDDVTDPTLEGIELSAIVLSPDSKLARLHYVAPKGRSREEMERSFERATGFMRARLAEGVEMKRTPELRFVFETEKV